MQSASRGPPVADDAEFVVVANNYRASCGDIVTT